jgi:hypothetical protein
MDEKPIPLKIHHYDIFNYLIDKKVSSVFKESTIRKIEGDYLIFRNSERNDSSINISTIRLRYSPNNNVFTFTSERKGMIKPNKLEDISTQGIFLKNSASTFVFLCRSVTSSKFAFLETITVLSTRPRDDDNYIVALFSGEIMSNNDYDNRPFSTKAVLVKIKDRSIMKEIEKSGNYILRDHPKDHIKDIVDIIDSKQDIKNINDDELTVKEKSFKNDNLYNALLKINNITSLSLILRKIENEIDKHFNVMILKN